MNDEIFEVTKEEYIGFIEQINPEMVEFTVDKSKDGSAKVYSKKTNKLLCAEYFHDGIPSFYVYEMPDDDERLAPKKHLKVQLNDEETHQFFKILAEAIKEKENAGTI